MMEAYPLRARQIIEDEIERLIGILDAIDPDPDLEPSLGLNGHLCNDPPDLEGDDCDLEPSLGAREGIFPQLNWCAGPLDDREEQCEDEGAQCDDEGMPDDEDHCNFGDDLGPLYNPDMAERSRVTDSVVAINDRLRAVMRKRGLDPVPTITNMEGSQWSPR